MEYVFTLNDCRIKVLFKEHSVHIINDTSLRKYIGADPVISTGILARMISEKFRERYGREFPVHTDSLIAEIWGHVYCGYFASMIERLVALKLVAQIADKVISYCEVIDCGAEGYDNNRTFWDMLAPFISMIGDWLPENIAEQSPE